MIAPLFFFSNTHRRHYKYPPCIACTSLRCLAFPHQHAGAQTPRQLKTWRLPPRITNMNWRNIAWMKVINMRLLVCFPMYIILFTYDCDIFFFPSSWPCSRFDLACQILIIILLFYFPLSISWNQPSFLLQNPLLIITTTHNNNKNNNKNNINSIIIRSNPYPPWVLHEPIPCEFL